MDGCCVCVSWSYIVMSMHASKNIICVRICNDVITLEGACQQKSQGLPRVGHTPEIWPRVKWGVGWVRSRRMASDSCTCTPFGSSGASLLLVVSIRYMLSGIICEMIVTCLSFLSDPQMVSYIWRITTLYYNSSVVAHYSSSSSSPNPPRCAPWNLFLYHHRLAQLPIRMDWLLDSNWISHYRSYWRWASCWWLGMGHEVKMIMLWISIRSRHFSVFSIFTFISIDHSLDTFASKVLQ